MVRVGVVGWPIKHSRSPVIFEHWFHRYGIEATYERIPVSPDDAPAFFKSLPPEFHGVNVTVPHKEMAAANAIIPPAEAPLASANTLWRGPPDDPRVFGASSDGGGFIANLAAADPAWWATMFGPGPDRPVVILGAGGAAAAIVNALSAHTGEIIVVNRTHARAEALCARLGTGALTAADIQTLPSHLERAKLLINATTLGMTGAPPLTIDLSPLPADAMVTDIVYTPLTTPLLAAAAARGLRTVDGLGMLLHQATLGFEKWFGIAPEVDAGLRAAVDATL
ncbi:MAG: saccharopine dehydrogenase NADP-binding domain-containing protein [Pseudomonadota bacterium]